MSSARVRRADWNREADRAALSRVRIEVFIEEQQVPPEMEWDEADPEAIHLLAELEDEVLGCARVLADGHIGRMAVLKPWRGRGVGSALLKAAVAACRELGQAAWLDAQLHAIPFYERHGFHAEGDTFMDAGIPHRRMRLSSPD